jgi:micrococcal nuclease
MTTPRSRAYAPIHRDFDSTGGIGEIRRRAIRRVAPGLLLAALVVACRADLPNEPTGLEAVPTSSTVTRVIDGDTVIVEGMGTVRLIGVDTPETVDPRQPVQYFGKEASDFTKQIATGKRVRLEFDQERTDRYDRTLAYLYLQPENLLLNAEIIRQGYGFAYTQFPFRMMEHFTTLEREAREAGRGLWAPRPAQPSVR